MCFFLLLAIHRTSSTTLSRSDECLVGRKAFGLSPLSIWHYLWFFSEMPQPSWRSPNSLNFYHESGMNFMHLLAWQYVFFFFHWLKWWIILSDFWMLKLLYSWDKSLGHDGVLSFLYFARLHLVIYVKDFCAWVHEWYWSLVIFPYCLCLVLISE